MPTLGFRRQVLLVISLLCGLLIVSVNANTLTAVAKIPTVAKLPTATKVAAIDVESMCKNVLDRAVQLTQQNCEATGRNQACYGYTRVKSELRSSADALPNQFAESGDILGLRYFSRIQTEPLNPVSGSWGMAVMKLQANLPDTNPGQNVTFILFGDTDLHPDLNRTNSFYLSTDLGSLTCRTLPTSSLIVRAPKGMTVEFTLNDVTIKIASIVVLRNDSKRLLVRGLEGHIEVSSFGVQRTFSAGQQVTVPMSGENASGIPSQPEPAPYEQPLDDLGRLAISIDTAGSDFSGDITLNGRVDAINRAVPSITLNGYLVQVGGVAGWQDVQVGEEVSVFGTFESYYVVAKRLTRLGQLTPSPTITPSRTRTITPTDDGDFTSTPSRTVTVTPTRTLTATASLTSSPTDVPTSTATDTATDVPTDTVTPEPSETNTRTPEPSDTAQPPPGDTPPPTDTVTPEPSNTLRPSATDTIQPAPTDTALPPTFTRTPRPTNTPRPTRTPQPTRTRRPSATPTVSPTTVKLDDVQVSALCSPTPGLLRRWRISNPNDVWITAGWTILGSQIQGILVMSPHASLTFTTPTQQGSNVLQVVFRGRVVATQPSSSETCATPVPPSLTPTASPIPATPTELPTDVPTSEPPTPTDTPTSEPTAEPPTTIPPTTVPPAAPTSPPNPPPAPDGNGNGNRDATSKRISPVHGTT